MAGEKVHVDWGPMMGSCYVSIMEADKFGPMLHIADDIMGAQRADIPRLLAGLTQHHDAYVSIEDVRVALPRKDAITWSDELKGDKFMGYEIRGKGEGFLAWVQGSLGGQEVELNSKEREDMLANLLKARDFFFPL